MEETLLEEQRGLGGRVGEQVTASSSNKNKAEASPMLNQYIVMEKTLHFFQ